MDIINSVREKADAGLTKDLLIYTGPGSDYGLSLALRIKTTIRPSAFITEDLSVLTERVSKPKLKPLIVLLVASSDEDLNDLLKLKDWLEDAKVILILPSDGWGLDRPGSSPSSPVSGIYRRGSGVGHPGAGKNIKRRIPLISAKDQDCRPGLGFGEKIDEEYLL